MYFFISLDNDNGYVLIPKNDESIEAVICAILGSHDWSSTSYTLESSYTFYQDISSIVCFVGVTYKILNCDRFGCNATYRFRFSFDSGPHDRALEAYSTNVWTNNPYSHCYQVWWWVMEVCQVPFCRVIFHDIQTPGAIYPHAWRMDWCEACGVMK
jgi:hypothetical protein